MLIAEALNPDFVERMWAFIAEGRYQNKMRGSEHRSFYRFENPENTLFPKMLEFFSRMPEQLTYSGEGELIPLPMEDEISSLSAILLDDEYYGLLKQGITLSKDVPVLGTEYLIPFKAKAWIDLSTRRSQGERIDSRSIKKHKNDVFRLSLIVSDKPSTLPRAIVADMQSFLEGMQSNPPDLRSLGLRGITVDTILERLRELYQG